ncbi:MAG: preprotein translocase subunit SecA, partial [Aeromicrobium sp.]
MHEWVTSTIGDVVKAYVTGATEGFPEEWELTQLWTALGTLYPVGVTIEQVEDEAGGREGLSRELLQEVISEDALTAYQNRETELGTEVMRELERRVVLSVLDRKWREHLYEMDYLREGIGLRAYSQRDPLVEYQREGFELFSAMMEGIAEESVGFLFNLDVQVEVDDSAAEAEAMQLTAKGLGVKSSQVLSYSAPSEDGEAEVHGETAEEDSPESEARRAANAKNRARQKAKQQRKSRKNNR